VAVLQRHPERRGPSPRLHEAAARLGLREITWSRPGYGGSTPWLEPGARMVDDVADAVAVLDHLGVGEFVTRLGGVG